MSNTEFTTEELQKSTLQMKLIEAEKAYTLEQNQDNAQLMLTAWNDLYSYSLDSVEEEDKVFAAKMSTAWEESFGTRNPFSSTPFSSNKETK